MATILKTYYVLIVGAWVSYFLADPIENVNNCFSKANKKIDTLKHFNYREWIFTLNILQKSFNPLWLVSFR